MKYELFLVVIFVVAIHSEAILDLKHDVANEFLRLFEKYVSQDNYYGGAKGDLDGNIKFDFIVVGSGPSGAVIANRLSEILEWNVLLIEAGEEASIITDIPAIAAALLQTDLNWGYMAEEQEGFCRGCIKKRLGYPRGKALGGTSIINYMLHVRGNPLDYDRWAAMGNPGWSYEEVLPYFLKMEDARIEKVDAGYHRQGGYLPVSDVNVRTQSVHAYVKAAQEAGHPYVDYNGKSQLGVSYVQTSTRNGRRYSAEKAFLRPVRYRKNLVITTNSRVVQVLIDPKTKAAYGVKYVKRGKTYIATASKEVILCAGVHNSPQLLMLSGVGPKDHLEELGIPVIKDLPVGEKMYDHASFPGVMFKLNKDIVYNMWKSLANPNTYYQYLVNGKGMLASTGFVEAVTYVKTAASNDPDPSYPDMELIYMAGGIHSDKSLFVRFFANIPKSIYNKIWKPLEHSYVYQVMPMLVHPKSCGYMKLKSKDPFEPAKFYANFFSDPDNHDIKTFIAAIREIQRINSSPALQRYNSAIVETPIPGCEQFEFNTDEYWECGLRTLSTSLYHQVATCKMGPNDDPEAVVDARLRVYGIKNLRVADSSIIPIPPTAHTMAPSYMVGEKAADIIKEDYNNL